MLRQRLPRDHVVLSVRLPPMAQTEGNRYDAIRDEINSRKTAVMNAKTLAAADRLDQYSTDTVGLSAKLEAYRRDSETRRSYHQTVS